MDIEKDMSPAERLVRAHDLSISAFLGDTIYNFGELVRVSCIRTDTGLIMKRIFVAHAPYPGRAEWDST